MTEATITTIILRDGFQILSAVIISVLAVRAGLSELAGRRRGHLSRRPLGAIAPNRVA